MAGWRARADLEVWLAGLKTFGLSIALSMFSAPEVWAQASREPASPVTIGGPARLLDGDTLEIGPVLVRLSGIDAPEVAQNRSGNVVAGLLPIGVDNDRSHE